VTACAPRPALAGQAAPPDTTASQPARPDAGVRGEFADTAQTESATIDSLQARLERSRWAGWISDLIFVGRAQSDTADVLPVTEIPTEAQYFPYAGRFIRRIDIARLPIFNTESVVPDGILRIGNAVHVDTRERVIRGYVLMEEGAPLDPYQLADTERILRSTPFIEDATIVVIPVGESADSVDCLVVTQDTWSIGLEGSIRGVGMYKAKILERNFLGMGHLIGLEADVSRNRSQEVNFIGEYRVNNLGGTFFDLDFKHVDTHIENHPQAVLSRPFITADIDYGGALRFSRVEMKDSLGKVDRSYEFHDLWVGRGWRQEGVGYAGRRLLTLGGRAALKSYSKRGPVNAESDRNLHNYTQVFGSLDWSRSTYRKALLLKAYGMIDDIGTGYLARLTSGYEFGEFNHRWYTGALYSQGWFEEKLGYYAWRIEGGGFFRQRYFEDGALRLGVDGFSRLFRRGRYRYRVFYGADYLTGFKRQSGSALILRVPGIETELADYQRLALGMEGVAFAPWRFLGFRFSLFGAIHVGTIGPKADSFLNGRYYPSFGAGLRLHSDQFVFGAYEIRVVYVPDIPERATVSRFDFSSVGGITGGDFMPGPPGAVSFE